MPYFDLDVDPEEYVTSCGKTEIKNLIEILVEEGHLPNNVLNTSNVESKRSYSRLQNEFTEKMSKLIDNYHSISSEDEEVLNNILKKYI